MTAPFIGTWIYSRWGPVVFLISAILSFSGMMTFRTLMKGEKNELDNSELAAEADEQLHDRVEQVDDDVRQQTEQDAAGGQPEQAEARQSAGVVRLGQLLLARLAEEDDSEELDHGEPGQRRDQRDGRGEHRGQSGQAGGRGVTMEL